MKQRVLLAQALMGNPEILILDEPTAGLDPEERIRIRNFISEISANKIVILATHVVSDIECIANEVLMLKKGKLCDVRTPQELIASVEGKVGEVFCELSEVKEYQEHYIIGNISQRKEGTVIRVVSDNLPINADKNISNINLEDVYLYYLEDNKDRINTFR